MFLDPNYVADDNGDNGDNGDEDEDKEDNEDNGDDEDDDMQDNEDNAGDTGDDDDDDNGDNGDEDDDKEDNGDDDNDDNDSASSNETDKNVKQYYVRCGAYKILLGNQIGKKLNKTIKLEIKNVLIKNDLGYNTNVYYRTEKFENKKLEVPSDRKGLLALVDKILTFNLKNTREKGKIYLNNEIILLCFIILIRSI